MRLHVDNSMYALVFLIALISSGCAAASGEDAQGDPETLVTLRIGEQMVDTYLAFEDYWYFVEDVAKALDIEPLFYVRNAATGNVEILLNEVPPIILYDRRISQIVGMDGAIAIIAHELGHFACQKYGRAAADLNERGLQADRYAGAALKRMGFAERLETPYAALLSKKGGATHPGRPKRNDAFRQGYLLPDKAVLCPRAWAD